MGLLLSSSIISCGKVISNQQAKFSLSPTPTPTPTQSGGLSIVPQTKTWQTAVLIDAAAVTAPSPTPATTPFVIDEDSGDGYAALAADRLAPVVASDTSGNLFIGFSMKATGSGSALVTPPSVDNVLTSVISTPTSFFANSWVSSASYSTLTELGGNLTVPAAIADPIGVYGTWLYHNGVGLIHGLTGKVSTTATDYRLYGSYHELASGQDGGWVRGVNPQEISSATSVLANAETNLCAPKIASDSIGRSIAVWCSGIATAYNNSFNLFTPNSGWGVASQINESVNYLGITYDTAQAGGIDAAVDSSGVGWIIHSLREVDYGTDSDVALVAQRVSLSNGALTGQVAVLDTIAETVGQTQDDFLMPRIWLRSDGSSSIFYYKSFNGNVSLWRVELASNGTASSPVQVDSADTTLYVSMKTVGENIYREPSLVFQGSYAAYAFSKPSTLGGNDRLYVTIYDGTSWSTASTVDDSSGYGIGWYSLAINPSASSTEKIQLILAYESLDSFGAATYVKVRTYNQLSLAFTPEQTLGSSLSATTTARPTAFATTDGKFGVSFMGTDSSGRRGVYVAPYY